ncbi:DUF3397 family protein [Apilactobacillus xinyiensis]|uniref:DUF3397 family protein n=1 Tax=Apilactobacillus xinyiensis TaxID=2841032 RepID=UPI001C7D725F|nr:DUF3397 family protein [Apilactobacillus xinyiensis]MCL0329885.1 DUF3397 family protein [Apilactobacillus xinyiensis]
MLLEILKLLLFQILFLFIFSVVFNIVRKIFKKSLLNSIKVNQFFMPIMFIYIRQISFSNHGYSLLPYITFFWSICLILFSIFILIKKGNIGYGELCLLLLKFSSFYSFIAWIVVVLFVIVKSI